MIRFTLYFALSFAILCIPTGDNRHLFDSLHSYVSPYAQEAVKITKQKFSTTSRYSKKLFSNSTPVVPGTRDEVTLQKSGINKEVIRDSDDDEGEEPIDSPTEPYTQEEQAQLKKVINDSNIK